MALPGASTNLTQSLPTLGKDTWLWCQSPQPASAQRPPLCHTKSGGFCTFLLFSLFPTPRGLGVEMALTVCSPINLSCYPWRGPVLQFHSTLPCTARGCNDACLATVAYLHKRRMQTKRGTKCRPGEQAQQSVPCSLAYQLPPKLQLFYRKG